MRDEVVEIPQRRLIGASAALARTRRDGLALRRLSMFQEVGQQGEFGPAFPPRGIFSGPLFTIPRWLLNTKPSEWLLNVRHGEWLLNIRSS